MGFNSGFKGLIYWQSYQCDVIQCHVICILSEKGLFNCNLVWKEHTVTRSILHVFCDCEAIATLIFRHLGQRFVKLGDFENMFVSRLLHFAQSAGLLNAWTWRLRTRSVSFKVYGSLHYPPFCMPFYSVLFYSILLYYILHTVFTYR